MRISIFSLIVILISLANYLDAQVGFPTANAEWRYDCFDDYGNYYKSIIVSPDSMVQQNGQTYTSIADGVLYRESNRQLFVIPKDSVNEILIYDFNLMVGDTFTANYSLGSQSPMELVVVQVDPVVTFDGLTRKKIQLIGSQGFGTWIEGIGSVETFSNTFYHPSYIGSVSGWCEFACLSVGNFVVYGSGSSPSSCLLSSVDRLENSSKVKIFPNPVSHHLNIELDNLEAEELLISDLTGTIILKQVINESRQISIPFNESFPPGIYLVKLVTKEGKFITRKVVKI